METKPVIYLLPGLLCDAAVWQHQQTILSKKLDVRIPDFKGMDSLVKMAERVLAQAPERFSVAGHSMGGRVGLELIHLAPERVENLVLLSVGAHAVNDEECEQRSSLVEEAASIGMEKYASSWAELMLSYQEEENNGARECIEAMARRQTLDDFIAHITAGLGRNDQARYLAHISIPVLLIVGAKDNWSPVSQHAEIRDQIPQARLEIVPDAGHMVTLNQPEVVSQLLESWIRRHSHLGSS